MTLSEADLLFATPERIKPLNELLKLPSTKRIRLKGLAGSAPAMLFALLEKRRKPYLLVADDADAAGYLYNDLCRVAGREKVAVFPSGYRRDIKYGQPDPPAQILRTDAIDAIAGSKELRYVVSYPEALAESVPAPDSLADHTLRLKTGTKTGMTDLLTRLREEGFRQTDYVYEPGQFARRGSIVDIYSFSNPLPYRLDFFGDEIDSIREFNVETQLSERRLEEISVIPAGMQTKSASVSLPEFIGRGCVLLCQSRRWLLDRVKAVCSETFSSSAMIAEEGDPDAMSNIVDFDAFEQTVAKMTCAEFGLGELPERGYDAVLDFNCTPQALYHKNFDLIAESFSSFIKKGYRILLLSDSPQQADRLRAIFAERGDVIVFSAVEGTIHEGFIDAESKVCFFTDHQIFDRFHKYSLKSDRARSGKLALSLKELNQIEIGDYIVHIDHGIGKFAGLIKTDVNGRPQEMIKLLYQNDDIILVSIHALHKLSKYRGKEGVAPKISKLGTGAWQRIKDRTKSKMKDIARDLIKLYAARRQEKGHAFAPDSYMQQELEASFVYEDTPDQLRATHDIKADMESPRPMDRLVCGDVGFGKTELAVRAAFKAAADGKQTALLVPTTVLAMQHYRTFKERLKDFPVTVDFLSRARSAKDVKDILTRLEEGKIDIIIGTHKLIGKSVKFHDLGLLIVDEEQKFGVAVKERLKQLKVNVDTLTMSATPIPRTLQFSLMGARDLSNITTPPPNRYPIMTSVNTLTDDLLAEAVNFEMSRNGQVFIINNRIEGLYQLEAMVKRVIPDARTIVAHGQMPPEKLEQAIIDFTNHDYDIMLATTIVESGIDMPNVNTMIVNNAQNFGLSELHQLRGRVGRSNRKAFCYLMVPPGNPLTPVARRRLQAIESFSDLGSGIHIAMQDLDIRGAGNLLGAEQSGFIADLGYETYQKILKEAVTELRTEEFADTFKKDEEASPEESEEFVADCVIESDLELLLPAWYVPQESERISLYRELDSMEREMDIREFRSRLVDRFGKIPPEAAELTRVPRLRRLARQLGIEKVALKQGQMYTYFVDSCNVAYYQSPMFGRMISYLQAHLDSVRIRENGSRRSFSFAHVPDVETAVAILQEILSLPSSPAGA